MNLILQKMTFVALAGAGAGAGVHGQELRGAAMVANADDAEAGLYPLNVTPAQRSCIDVCHDGRLTKQHKKISCENKCLKLVDEGAKYVADFLKDEDIEFIADFLSDEESRDVFEAKGGNWNWHTPRPTDYYNPSPTNYDYTPRPTNYPDDYPSPAPYPTRGDRPVYTPYPTLRATPRPTFGRRATPRPTPRRRDTPSTTKCSGDPCSTDVIFCGEPQRERGTLERAARDGTLKHKYKDVWKNTKKERKWCKKSDKETCKRHGYCLEGEDEFDEVEY